MKKIYYFTIFCYAFFSINLANAENAAIKKNTVTPTKTVYKIKTQNGTSNNAVSTKSHATFKSDIAKPIAAPKLTAKGLIGANDGVSYFKINSKNLHVLNKNLKRGLVIKKGDFVQEEKVEKVENAAVKPEEKRVAEVTPKKPEPKSEAKKSSSSENRVYAGIDIIYSKTNHKLKNLSDPENPSNGLTSKGQNVGIGLDLGYKVNFGKAFIAPEVFYDYLNNSACDFTCPFIANVGTMEVNSRYGTKLNLGYNIFPKLNAFVNLGLANIRYAFNDAPSQVHYKASKLSPIYGIGLSYDLDHSWTLRTSYDYQNFNARYYSNPPGWRDTISLKVFKIGAVYNF